MTTIISLDTMINITILKMSTRIFRNELQNIMISSQWLI